MLRVLAGIAVSLVLCAAAHGGEAYAPMAPFAPYAGKTWRGTVANPDGSESVDVARWEFILGGRALQTTHRIEGGTYGGRMIAMWDEGAEEYVFHYFTTGGFHTQGTMRVEDGKIITIEDVKGHPEITRVRATMRLEDGKMISDSEYLKKGEWVAGHRFVYVEAPDAVVGY